MGLGSLIPRWTAKSALLWLGFAVTALFTYLSVRNAHVGDVSTALQESNYWWLLPALVLLAVAVLIRAIRWRALFLPERRPSLSDVTALFTYLSVRNAHVGDVSTALQESNYWWLLPALVLLGAAVLIRAIRWRALFLPERRPALGDVTSALMVGYFFNNVLPARAGEAARVVALHQSGKTSRAETIGTVVVERAYDVLSLLFLLFVALPWLPGVSWLGPAAVFAGIFGAAFAALIVMLFLFADRPVRFLLRPLARVPFLSAERVEHAALNLTVGFAAVRKPSLAVAAFCWTTLSWLVMALSFWLVMLGFDLGLSPVAALFVVIAINLAMILPSSPAAIGVFEAATLLAVGAYGVSESVGLSYALVLHAMNFVPYLVAGAIVLHLHATSVRREAARSGGTA